jgi:hypothetical protein
MPYVRVDLCLVVVFVGQTELATVFGCVMNKRQVLLRKHRYRSGNEIIEWIDLQNEY